MRSIVCAVAALALMALPLARASAQDTDQPTPPPKAPAPALPNAPVPYAKLRPKPKPKPKPPASAEPASPTAAGGATTPTPATASPSSAPAKPAATPGPSIPAATPKPAAPRPAPATPTPAPAPVVQAAAAPPPAEPAPRAPAARLAPGQPIAPAELETFVDGYVRGAMAREHIAGVTVSVVQNGQAVLKKGYGFASLNPQRPVDPDRTLFRIGSISKTFTWITVMKEVEAGRMRLDQPINLYLPEKVQVRDQGFDQPVRVQNLMDHSAGFEDRALGQLFERDFERVRPLDIYLRQERPRRVHAPGVLSSYSNFGAALAGEAAAYTSGKPYERLVEDEILTPLGMGHTTFREPHPAKAGLPAPMPAVLAADVSDGYRWTPAGFEKRDYEYIGQIAPAGAGSSTAGDMARYMLMQLGNGQSGGAVVYGARAAEAFRTPLRRTPPGVNGWAHGFAVRFLPGGHTGYGHDGGTLSFLSEMVVVPDLNLGVFVSTNTETGGALSSALPAAIVREFYAAPQLYPRPGSPELAQDGGALKGYYLSTRRPYSGLESFVYAFRSGATVGTTGDGRLVVSDPGGVSSYVPEGPLEDGRFIGVSDESRLAFALHDGRAVNFIGSSGSALFQRASFWRAPSTLAMLAALAALAAVATLGGVAVRNRREFRENQVQSRASLVQNIQAVLWLAAMALFGLWFSKTGDIAQIMYRWPGALMIMASACALVAAGLTATTVIALPAVWQGGRRVDSWSPLRKAGFTLTVLIYLAFSVVLGVWGALSPWSG
jgi:CubicO group peptidase (beta-lactamase class C family)